MYENHIYSDASYSETPVSGGNGQQNSGQSPVKKGGILRKVMFSICLGLCFGLFAGIGFYAVQVGTSQNAATKRQEETLQQNETEKTEQPYEKEDGDTDESQGPAAETVVYVSSDVSDVVEDVMPAMVSIVNDYTETGTTIWGQTYSQPGEGSGSGIIVSKNDDELLIVSNNHVVEDADKLTVTFINGTEADAVIKGLDSDMDLAVIAVPMSDLDEDTLNAINIATLGDSDELKLGEPVIAIGNALGYGQSVTCGYISALNREIALSDGSTGTFIQTDAAINPGNSGGALLNIKGEVIGINSNKMGGTAVEGMGYAIPITSASPIIADLMERQTRSQKMAEDQKGYMGITLQNITQQISMMYGMPQGAFVVSVEPGLAADQAGILKGDIVTKFDGQTVDSAEDLTDLIQYYAAGETVEIQVMRVERGEYLPKTLKITLGNRAQ